MNTIQLELLDHENSHMGEGPHWLSIDVVSGEHRVNVHIQVEPLFIVRVRAIGIEQNAGMTACSMPGVHSELHLVNLVLGELHAGIGPDHVFLSEQFFDSTGRKSAPIILNF